MPARAQGVVAQEGATLETEIAAAGLSEDAGIAVWDAWERSGLRIARNMLHTLAESQMHAVATMKRDATDGDERSAAN